jgi:hypothetical protein
MEAAELMRALMDLADQAQLEVRVVGRAEAGESPPGSAVCKVRGKLWVVLSANDPSDVQLEVLARALRENAAELVEGSYLPPAVRALLEGG